MSGGSPQNELRSSSDNDSSVDLLGSRRSTSASIDTATNVVLLKPIDGKGHQDERYSTDQELAALQSQLEDKDERLAELRELLQDHRDQQMGLVPAITQMYTSAKGVGADNVIVQTYSRLESEIAQLYVEFKKINLEKYSCKRKIMEANTANHAQKRISEDQTANVVETKLKMVMEAQKSAQPSNEKGQQKEQLTAQTANIDESEDDVLSLHNANVIIVKNGEETMRLNEKIKELKEQWLKDQNMSSNATTWTEMEKKYEQLLNPLESEVRRLRKDAHNAIDEITQIQTFNLLKTAFADIRFHASDSSLIITSVESGSEAEQKGIKIGDRILKVNGKFLSIGDSEMFIKALFDQSHVFSLTIRPYSNVLRNIAAFNNAIGYSVSEDK